MQCDLPVECAALAAVRGGAAASPPGSPPNAPQAAPPSEQPLALRLGGEWDSTLFDLDAFAYPGAVGCGEGGGGLSGSDEGEEGLTWFSAGLRVGVGVGLGMCLGVGIGVGILVNSWRAGKRRLASAKDWLL